MSIPTGIKDYPITIETSPVQLIDEFAFHIALKIFDLNRRKFLFQRWNKVFKAHLSIGIWLPFSGKIQIWTVYNADLHNDK